MISPQAETLQYAPKIFGMAVQASGNPKVAEEILQQVFLEAFSKVDALPRDRTLEVWLCRIALKTIDEKFRDKNGPAEAALDSGLPRSDLNGKSDSVLDDFRKGGATW